MTLYSAETLDLSRLAPAPLVSADYDAIRREQLAKLQELWDAARLKDPTLPVLDVLGLRANPATILTDEFAYGLTHAYQAINDAAKELRLAQSFAASLDHLTTTYHRTHRQILSPATPETPAVLESDSELRLRAQLQPEQLAEFGLTPGSYIYRVRTAFADRIKDVRAIRRGGGSVELRVLGRTGDGAVPPATVAEIIRAFHPEGVSQSTDTLSVVAAEIDRIPISVRLLLRSGPDPDAVRVAALASLRLYAASLHRIGATVYSEAVSAAAHVGPVETVIVETPQSNLLGRQEAAPFITDIDIRTDLA